MGRTRRLGVALVLAGPIAHEVEGLRRALGDGALGTIEPHLTLVPPVNVAGQRVDEAVDVVRAASAWAPGPIDVVLGPVRSFLPDSPVLYLALDDAGATAATDLRERCLQGPLDRPGRWPFVAHVTVCDEIDDRRAQAAQAALSSFRVGVSLDRLVLLEQSNGAWHELADALLGPGTARGRGGIETQLIGGRVPAPDALALFDQADGRPWERTGPVGGMLVVTARRAMDGHAHPVTVGAAVAWSGPVGSGLPHVAVVVGMQWRREGLGRALVQQVAALANASGWSSPRALGHGPLGFFSASSGWVADLGD